MRVLLVEDEENIREVVKLNLEMENYEVVTAEDGRKALKHFKEQHFDVVLLDVMLPEIDGFQVCEQIRLTDMKTPVMMLTAKDAVAVEIYEFGGHTVNFVTFEAQGNNGTFTLTKKEAMLLKLLVDRQNEVVSRQQILQSVWGYDVYPSTRTIDNFILSFRKYFEDNPKKPTRFLSIRGVGYKFVG